MPIEKAIIGAAGEHLVLSRLYQHGILASLAPPGASRVDVLVMSADETVTATIQVKTRIASKPGPWIMGRKNEEFVEKRAFYALVDLGTDPQRIYVVPSGLVAAALKADHRAWMSRVSSSGQPHQDNDVRQLRPAYTHSGPSFQAGWLEPFSENWDQLKAAVT